MFLDIVGSTDLYAHLGDGKALELVRAYFEAIFSVVASQGRIVKTIGDAVMAAFPTPETALLSAAEAMRVVAEHCTNPQTQRPLAVRVGIHRGPALVVPLNGINDFFGQTVNITARVEAAANPSELLITEALLADPAARSAYTRLTNSDGYRAGHSRKLALKGVEKAQEVRSLHLALSGY
jgi:class 3 adenylate cyclase